MSKIDDAIARIPYRLWNLFSEQKWDEARELIDGDEFEAYWPQTREKIVGRDNFIEVNRRLAGVQKISLQGSHYVYDRWDHTYKVTTEVHIESQKSDGARADQFVISMWDLDSEGLITGVQEFRAECSEPPASRSDLVERY